MLKALSVSCPNYTTLVEFLLRIGKQWSDLGRMLVINAIILISDIPLYNTNDHIEVIV